MTRSALQRKLDAQALLRAAGRGDVRASDGHDAALPAASPGRAGLVVASEDRHAQR